MRVYGHPMPKGSHTAVVRGSRAVLLDARRGPARKRYAEWEKAVRVAAHAALFLHPQASLGPLFTGPVRLEVTFFFPRPKSHPKKNRHPLVATRPDLDKLLRALKDPMTLAGVWTDDSLVSQISAAKVYALHEEPGAAVTVTPA